MACSMACVKCRQLTGPPFVNRQPGGGHARPSYPPKLWKVCNYFSLVNGLRMAEGMLGLVAGHLRDLHMIVTCQALAARG